MKFIFESIVQTTLHIKVVEMQQLTKFSIKTKNLLYDTSNIDL